MANVIFQCGVLEEDVSTAMHAAIVAALVVIVHWLRQGNGRR